MRDSKLLEEKPEQEAETPAPRVSLVRASWIALALVAAVLVVVAIALMITDGSPHVPFDYGEF